MLKILHTADWHLGKKLHGEDLSEDMHLFFDWLLKYSTLYGHIE